MQIDCRDSNTELDGVCRKNVLFWNAIQKYGWDNFQHEIIASGLTSEEAGHMEQLLIKELNLANKDYGYNQS